MVLCGYLLRMLDVFEQRLVCICIYVCVDVCTYLRTHVCDVCACIHMLYIYMNVTIHMNKYTYIRTYTHVRS